MLGCAPGDGIGRVYRSPEERRGRSSAARAWNSVDVGSIGILGRAVVIDRLWVVLGCLTVLFPAVYISVDGWNSGEHANVVISFGVFVSVIQAVMWVAIWKTSGDLSIGAKQRAFGIGAILSLLGSIVAGNATQSIAVAGGIYVTIALLALVATRRILSRTSLS